MSRPVRVRFAPSPTGMFHVGSARTALFNWLFARHHHGAFILRVEDTDESRNRPEWTSGILSAMRWLGLDWDEGPYFQSERAERHAEAARLLFERGAAYYCDCTPEARHARAAVRGGPPGYDGYCRGRGLGPGEGRALRFRAPDTGVTVVHDLVRGEVAFDNATIEDFVIVKANGGAIFHLANTVDDLDMAISHVLRAEEHLPNTPKALLLWGTLAEAGWAGTSAGSLDPPQFGHLPLLVNEARKKLSKRRDRVSLEDFRDEGYLMEAVRNYLCLLGWSPGGDREFLTIEETIAEFRLSGVNNSPAFFDVRKLAAFNQHYLAMLSDEGFAEAAAPFLERARWDAATYDAAVFRRMVPSIKSRVRTLAEVPAMVDFLFVAEPPIDPASWDKGVVKVGAAPDILAAAASAYAETTWESSVLHDVTEKIGIAHGLPLAKAQAPIRVAVTGRTVGPPLFESLEVLGRDRAIERLRAALGRRLSELC